MSLVHFETCCSGLESPKITKRRQCAKELKDLLVNIQLCEKINASTSRWDSVFNSVQRFVCLEGEKLNQDECKQKSGASALTSVTSLCQPLLMLVISKANSGEHRLTASKFLESVYQSLRSEFIVKYFSGVYLTILVKHILPVRSYWGKISQEKWKKTFVLLKELCVDSAQESNKQVILRGLYLIVKWGSLQSSITVDLRQEFDFIKDLCLPLSANMFKVHQEVTLQLLLSFCTQVAKDCRMASCKLGEDISQSLFNLYEPRYGLSEIKSLLFDFMLLQIRLHHPNGALEHSDSAYAYDWPKWKALLRSLYSILNNEVDVILRNASLRQSDSSRSAADVRQLQPNFGALYAEVARQVLNSGVLNVTQAQILVDFEDGSQPVAKRARLEIGMDIIISSVKSKENWPWLAILAQLLTTYPDTIQPNEFVVLLENLAVLQAECKDANNRDYLYKLLSVMVQVQDTFDDCFDLDKIDNLWAKVCETGLRSVGLNQNEDATHKFLQNMLHYKKTSQTMHLLQMYLSGVLNISIHSITTLNILCKTIAFTELISDIRKFLINHILGLNKQKVLNHSVYTERITAQVLIGLVIKQWPYHNNYEVKQFINREYKCIEDTYRLLSFDGELICEDRNKTEVVTTENILLHFESFMELTKAINLFINKLLTYESAIDYINGLSLIVLLLSEMLNLEILQEQNINEICDVKQLFKHLYEIVDKQLKDTSDKIPILEQIERLFSLELTEKITILIRKEISVNFIKLFFDLLNTCDQTDADDMAEEGSTKTTNDLLNMNTLKYTEKIELYAMKILGYYCCVPGAKTMNPNQHKALLTLCIVNSDEVTNIEFQSSVHFLRALTSCTPGVLNHSYVSYILKSMQHLMEEKHKEYNAAVILLDILKAALPHVELSNSHTYKKEALVLLTPFFNMRESYGPYLTVCVANCIGDIIKLDSQKTWPNFEEMIEHLFELIQSDSQEIRSATIYNILNLFSPTSTESHTKQTQYFQITCEKILASFTVDDNLSESIDEAVNRTSNALHTYAAIIVASPVWRKQCLFAMIRLISVKQINLDLVQKVLKIIGEKLKLNNAQDLIDLNFIVFQWDKNGYQLNDLPFQLFGCDTGIGFFIRYLNSVLPVLLKDERKEVLKSICEETNKTLQDVMKESYPSLIAQFLPTYNYGRQSQEHNITNDDINTAKLIYRHLNEIFTPDHFEILGKEMLDQIYYELLNRYFDKDHFKTQFEFFHILPEPNSPFHNKELFDFTINYIESKLFSNTSIVSYCIDNCPWKLEQLLLKTTANLLKTPTREEKLINFHRYSVLIDYITPEFQQQNEMKIFLIRNITYTIMNIIRKCNDDEIPLGISACRYFQTFFTKTISYCADIFEKLLVLIISTLVPIAKLNLTLSDECVALLNFIIIENSKYLYNSIGCLDPFPDGPKFENMQLVYEKIKYGNARFSLTEEIEHFLNAGNSISDRTEGLKYLKIQLSEKKTELVELYADLTKLRGFCEDCESSILHRLICMLVQLTTGETKVSLEAARCLGELGPADLTTLVLKPEHSVINNNYSPAVVVTGQIVVLLTQYLVNDDAAVLKAVSDALYVVLRSKEGKHIVNLNAIDFGCGILEKSFITPFISTKKAKDSRLSVDENLFSTQIDRNDLWCPTLQCSHDDWIIVLVCALLSVFPEQCFLRALIPVCKTKIEFAPKLFPLLIFLLLAQNKDMCTTILSKQIRNFFTQHWSSTVPYQATLSQNSTASIVIFNRASVQCMLNVVHFIRTQQNKEKIDELDLNYLHVAQSAQFCSAYFTSILYGELWYYDKIHDKNSQINSTSIFDLCEDEPELAQAFENLMRLGYKKIGDIDAIQGCGSSYLLNTKSRVEYYKNLGHWDKVALYYDSQLSYGLQNASTDLMCALKNNSFHYLASNFNNKDDLNTQYECAWRLSKWDVTESECGNYEKYHYFALKSLHETDTISMNQSIIDARKCVIQTLSHASLESSKNLYKALTDLQLLQEIENFSQAKLDIKLPELINKWDIQNLNKNEFNYIEPIKTQRVIILNDIYMNENTPILKTTLAELHLQLAQEARTEGFYPVAQRALNTLSFIETLTPELKGRFLFEQAQLSWLDDKTSARYLLKHLLDIHDTIPPVLHAIALRIYGNWMVETRSENPTLIIEKYFQNSLQILNGLDDMKEAIENRCDAMDSLARFADAEYQHVTSYIKSSVFETKTASIKKLNQLATSIRLKGEEKSGDERRALTLYERQSRIDEAEVNNAYNEKNTYLTLAVTQYIRILEQCDTYNLKIFRILSLSLDNKSNESLLKILKKTLPKIATYKYIPLLPQLVPHIESNQADFSKIIQDLLERCAVDHPHHTLPIILALAASYKDRDYDKDNAPTTTEARVQTARTLLKKYKNNKSLTSIIKNMESISTALISLAYLEGPRGGEKQNTIPIPSKEPIRSLRLIDNVLLPTINMEVRKNCNYENIVGIRQFSRSYSFVGGINAPKRITCTGTDGIIRTQLIKGRDDLRQDAVMQQVFTIMNTLLAKNKQTRKLLIRTYKVVPLSQRSGIIEWCENTEPLGGYLIEAHKKYNPTDLTPNECRNLLRNASSKDPDTKYRVYKQICSQFRPVFHMFFISSYPQPTIWYERRRAYMHSVATNSMVGYILGLGDRHVTNILLDNNTAEVIHIDFGIAFEQGKVLPTPETVPFRLTRDIEAGMGICGIEGVFRRTCEKTMHVLRQNAETVITILEVLLYDPLYVWTITAAEAYSRQRDDDQQSLNFSAEDATSVNVTAERVLLRLKQKLQGTENGGVCSVEGQVEQLLQQARDPVNLSRLYMGWQPFL